MALPTNPSNNPEDAARRLDIALQGAYREGERIKNQCVALSLPLHDLVSARLQGLIVRRNEVFQLSTVPGIDVAYQARYNNKAFSFSTDVAAVISAIDVLINLIVTQIPADGPWLNTLEFNDPASGDYTLSQRVITNGAALAPLEQAADNLLAVFDVT